MHCKLVANDYITMNKIARECIPQETFVYSSVIIILGDNYFTLSKYKLLYNIMRREKFLI